MRVNGAQQKVRGQQQRGPFEVPPRDHDAQIEDGLDEDEQHQYDGEIDKWEQHFPLYDECDHSEGRSDWMECRIRPIAKSNKSW